MRYLKLVLVSFFIFASLLSFISLFFPPQVTVMRTDIIRAPKDSVWSLLANTSHWHKWMVDSSVTVQPQSIQTVGKASVVLVGNKKVKIINATNGFIETEWEMTKMKNQIMGFYVKENKDGLGSDVQIYLTQPLRWYPWEKIASAMSEKTFGPAIESQIKRLKSALE